MLTEDGCGELRLPGGENSAQNRKGLAAGTVLGWAIAPRACCEETRAKSHRPERGVLHVLWAEALQCRYGEAAEPGTLTERLPRASLVVPRVGWHQSGSDCKTVSSTCAEAQTWGWPPCVTSGPCSNQSGPTTLRPRPGSGQHPGPGVAGGPTSSQCRHTGNRASVGVLVGQTLLKPHMGKNTNTTWA